MCRIIEFIFTDMDFLRLIKSRKKKDDEEKEKECYQAPPPASGLFQDLFTGSASVYTLYTPLAWRTIKVVYPLLYVHVQRTAG